VVLDEDDLANPGDDQGSDQSDPTTATGSFGVTAPDGLDDVQVNGVDVVVDGVFVGAVEVANDGIYAVSITGWTPVFAADGVTVISATFSYSASLLDNTLEHALPGQDDVVRMLAVTADDSDGSNATASLDVQIIDDVPSAADDTDSLTEGGAVSASGNVITDAEANGDNGADVTGADGAAVETPGSFDGTYGTLVLGADGSYTYTLSAFGVSQLSTLGDGEFFTEVFDYVLIDGDGDTSPATLTITLNGTDDGVTINGLDGNAPEVVLDEDDLANPGDDQGSDQSDPTTATGSFGVTAPDGLDDVQVNGVDVVVDGVFVGAVEVANDGIYAVSITGWTPVFAADGVTVISATFSYSASLLDNTLEHALPGQDDVVRMLAVTADDSDGSNATASLDVQIIDDVPSVIVESSGQTASVDETSLAVGVAQIALGSFIQAIDTDVALSATVVRATSADKLVTATANYGADGEATTGELIYAFALGADVIPNVTTTVGTPITLVKVSDTVVVGQIGASNFAAFALQLNSDGSVTLEQYVSLFHTNPLLANEPVTLTGADLSITVTVKDGDNDIASDSVNVADQITFNDDAPSAIDPDPVPNDKTSPDALFNIIGDTTTISLDADGNVFNNFGADGPGSITFANIVSGVTNSGLFHDGQPILLYLDPTGTILTGRALVGATLQDVFTATINQSTSDYTVELIRTIDNGSGATFNDLSGGVAGNPPFKLVSSATTGADIELLFTPREAGNADLNGSINSDSDDLGVNGQFIDLNFGVSIEFGDFSYFANGGGTSDDRYDQVSAGDINGFRFTIDQISNGSTVDVQLKAYEYTGDPSGIVQQSLPNEGAYSQEQITSVKVYDAAGNLLHTITFGWTIPGVPVTAIDADGLPIASGSGSLSIGGITFGAITGGSVLVSNLLTDYKVETFTADGYDRITIDNVGNPVGTDGKFSISELQIEQTNAGNPVNLQLDLQITDGDGDTVLITDAIDITVLPAADAPMPPIALDLNGDGQVSFLGLEAGVAYDYDGDGVATQTAWVAPEDGLLARQTEDGGVDIVFTDDAAGATTDLDGLAKAYDSNGDGQFTAADKAFDSFGVWQDANSNGVVDAGEFTSLANAGITAIDLISDGQGYTAANGEVTVYGTGSFTIEGATGVLVDAAFMLGDTVVANDSGISTRIEQRIWDGIVGSSAIAGFLAVLPLVSTNHNNLGWASIDMAGLDVSLSPSGQCLMTAEIRSFEIFESSAHLDTDTSMAWAQPETYSSSSEPILEYFSNPFDGVDLAQGMPSIEASGFEHTLDPETPAYAAPDMAALVAMEALLMLSDQNGSMPAPLELLTGDFTSQTIADALAGDIVDQVIDQFVGSSESASFASEVASSDQLIDLLSVDLSGAAMASVMPIDAPAVDDAAQVALMHG
ncbi:DUF5801 repeats-in-toxin domain-containing protein, partial [Erythrobacter sp. sf7]